MVGWAFIREDGWLFRVGRLKCIPPSQLLGCGNGLVYTAEDLSENLVSVKIGERESNLWNLRMRRIVEYNEQIRKGRVLEEKNSLGRLPCLMTKDYGDRRFHRKWCSTSCFAIQPSINRVGQRMVAVFGLVSAISVTVCSRLTSFLLLVVIIFQPEEQHRCPFLGSPEEGPVLNKCYAA